MKTLGDKNSSKKACFTKVRRHLKLLAHMKELLRHKFKEARCSISKEERERQSQIILKKLQNLDAFKAAQTIAVYLSKEDEVDTHALLTELWSSSKTVLAPRTEGVDVHLQIITQEADLELGNFDILEPKKDCHTVDPEAVDLILVPGVAFTQNGARLGHGKGHYDRLLAQTSAIKVGLAFTEQIAETLPQEAHDIPLNFILTP